MALDGAASNKALAQGAVFTLMARSSQSASSFRPSPRPPAGAVRAATLRASCLRPTRPGSGQLRQRTIERHRHRTAPPSQTHTWQVTRASWLRRDTERRPRPGSRAAARSSVRAIVRAWRALTAPLTYDVRQGHCKAPPSQTHTWQVTRASWLRRESERRPQARARLPTPRCANSFARCEL